MHVRRIELIGGTVFEAARLRPLLAHYENRTLGDGELEELRHRLTRLYVDAGFINSGARIPDQSVADGVLRIELIEGRLTGVRVTGEHGFDPAFIAARLVGADTEVLDVNRLQQRMQLLLQHPQIARLNAELAPGLRPGEGVLAVAVKEAERLVVGAELGNQVSPGVGRTRGEISAGFANPLGRGDLLSLRAGHTDGLDDLALGYELPLDARDTALALRYERNRANVVEVPFDAIDIGSRTTRSEIALTHPVVRTVTEQLLLGLALSRQDSATSLLGQPFSFAPGVNDGKSTLAAWQAAVDWIVRGKHRAVAARVSINRGVAGLGATINTDGSPDSRFTTLQGRVQWIERAGEHGAQWVMRAQLQRADGALLPLAKFSLGGAGSVRGYRENRLVRDHGWAASVEYRHPLARFASLGGGRAGEATLAVAAFIDAGRAWDEAPGAAQPTLYAAGPGIRLDSADGFGFALYRGLRLGSTPKAGNSAQDDGLHFRLGYRHAF